MMMRLDKPPLFMTSPAMMNSGMASRGKLPAELMMFCAMIWPSNRPSSHIKATPQRIRA
ncbi:hypothetical protein D3C80_2087100 [compost metagenome]